jgi:hypothetical protein|tara:strand:+ start:34 stop:477 length:444 start_codon:yes stop_codon:yes gene_type:complete
MSRIVSFRGRMANDDIETIALETNTGLIGYRIVKFDIFPVDPFKDDYESIVQVFKTPQTAASDEVDFSNNRLIAAAMHSSRGSAESYPEDKWVLFDNEKFNQNIFVTYKDQKTNSGCNYYIELEQMKLDLNEQTVATLKDIRNIGAE